ncbi:hypothetical protein PUW24_10830 [Paenibacillus urinalis]|uniref:Pre-toxin TG domain-containing protein n=2 Tax=Paenibacillus TaxID=44249 RepID=A0ABY7XBI2_9BACL|nr:MULTISPECIES: hypothetical protein [Paenibacillus]WDH99330.1 hypothetical protein PUW24_10830 [Paenibacillus urinalis]WDI03024.1 hypothetical protein PUW25_03275 [Paenibacillus urinalis]GAK41713.1 hypothetical protein TCA2_4205 [Paenibacillus sp. TCA20]SDX40356.1 hypothetical protein SAMN05518848_10725 [Paenibacillus sp. PDC88]
MPIFYPDNDNRKRRLIELATDTENFLYDATANYNDFKALCTQVNAQIVSVYQEAGLKQPDISQINVIKQADPSTDINTEETVVAIAEVIVDVAGFIGSVKYLAPAATKMLVRAGLMTEETAAKVLTKFTVPLIDREVEITAGDLAGSILGGIAGGVAVAGIDLGIDAIEGSIAKNKLRTGLHQIYPMRQTAKMSLDQTKELKNSIQSVKTTLDAITGAGIELNEQIITNLITKDVLPSVQKAQAITLDVVNAELSGLDTDRKSWTNEDTN